jgi:hypothetical protein
MASDNPLDVPPAPQDLVRTCDRRGPIVNDRCIAACAAAAACMKVVRFTADGPPPPPPFPLLGPHVPLATAPTIDFPHPAAASLAPLF